MENPQLGILSMTGNPRKKGKKMARRKRSRKGKMPAGLARYWASHRRGKRAAPKRRRTRRARKNWLSPGVVAAVNPRRRRRARRNPVSHHRRKHYRRNPAFLGIEMPEVKTILFAGVGFVGPSFVTAQLNSFVPSLVSQVQSMGVAGKYILKIGSVIGLTYLVKRFVGSREGSYVAMGGALNVGMSLVNDFAPGILPANPLAMYVANNQRPGNLSSYVPVRQGLRAIPAGRNIMRMPNASAQGDQGQYGTPARYYRY